jgi:pimeloyl-ACP methyl ester carboxylesterase
MSHWMLLHGTPLTSAAWDQFAPRLAETGATVMRPSLDARGDSTTHAERLLGTLRSGDRVHLVGHSFGAQVAIEMVLEAPERFASLALVCGRADPFPGFASAAEAVRAGARPGLDATMRRWFTSGELASGDALIPYARERVRVADRDVWADALDSIASFDRLSAVEDIRVPTVCVAAGHDTVSTPEAMAVLSERIPGGRLRVFHDSGHMGVLLRRTRLLQTIVDNAAR